MIATQIGYSGLLKEMFFEIKSKKSKFLFMTSPTSLHHVTLVTLTFLSKKLR